MKKILVLSDIHIPTRLTTFPLEAINKHIDKIDMIFGLGDYETELGLNNLYSFNKEVFAVAGNMDDPIIKSTLPLKLTIKVEEIKIGLTHGHGSPFGIKEKIAKEFGDIDLICFGHTHQAYHEKKGNITYFNPGSMTGNNPTFGILTINKNKIKTEIINI